MKKTKSSYFDSPFSEKGKGNKLIGGVVVMTSGVLLTTLNPVLGIPLAIAGGGLALSSSKKSKRR